MKSGERCIRMLRPSIKVVLALINFNFHKSDEQQPNLDDSPDEV